MKILKKFLAIATICLLFSVAENRDLDFTLPVDPGKVRKVDRRPVIRRHHFVTVVKRPSWSLDFPMESGEQVGAIGSGQVLEAEYSRWYGNYVLVQHNDSITSQYAHLSALKVQEGQRVNKGQLLGLVGNTGLSAAPHLALYMRINGELVWPCRFLPCERLPTRE